MENKKIKLEEKILLIKKAIFENENFSKNKEVGFGNTKYKYLEADKILSILNNYLFEYKVNFNFIKTENEKIEVEKNEKSEKNGYIFFGKTFWELENIENKEEVKVFEIFATAKNTDPAKAFGSAVSYARRYLLLNFLNIPNEETAKFEKNIENENYNNGFNKNFVKKTKNENENDIITDNQKKLINVLYKNLQLTKEQYSIFLNEFNKKSTSELTKKEAGILITNLKKLEEK